MAVVVVGEMVVILITGYNLFFLFPPPFLSHQKKTGLRIFFAVS